MKHIKLFESYINEASGPKFVWKRANKSYGLSAVGTFSDRRTWYLTLHNKTVIGLNNSSATSLNSDDLKQWKVMIYTTSGGNISLKKRFELDHIEDAKKWCEELYIRIANSTPETEKDQNILDMKKRMVLPEKIIKVQGPFREVFKQLKTGMGDRFSNLFGTDLSFKPFRYGKDFDTTGIMTWAGSGKPETYLTTIKAALGDKYDVEENNRTVKFIIK